MEFLLGYNFFLVFLPSSCTVPSLSLSQAGSLPLSHGLPFILLLPHLSSWDGEQLIFISLTGPVKGLPFSPADTQRPPWLQQDAPERRHTLQLRSANDPSLRIDLCTQDWYQSQSTCLP